MGRIRFPSTGSRTPPAVQDAESGKRSDRELCKGVDSGLFITDARWEEPS